MLDYIRARDIMDVVDLPDTEPEQLIPLWNRYKYEESRVYHLLDAVYYRNPDLPDSQQKQYVAIQPEVQGISPENPQYWREYITIYAPNEEDYAEAPLMRKELMQGLSALLKPYRFIRFGSAFLRITDTGILQGFQVPRLRMFQMPLVEMILVPLYDPNVDEMFWKYFKRGETYYAPSVEDCFGLEYGGFKLDNTIYEMYLRNRMPRDEMLQEELRLIKEQAIPFFDRMTTAKDVADFLFWQIRHERYALSYDDWKAKNLHRNSAWYQPYQGFQFKLMLYGAYDFAEAAIAQEIERLQSSTHTTEEYRMNTIALLKKYQSFCKAHDTARLVEMLDQDLQRSYATMPAYCKKLAEMYPYHKLTVEHY